ncbi:hypothetical protein SSPO_057200 [Streptomyces antimycoticus]|uniref:Uncharacterized protein n=1 Tax=Streptomyces antimycoticus TaxID=68175 RepID=A0A499UPP0_9ACTN|nr:hypothetical protein SSPO_057200 [Streptomyces antimycoticus]
MTDSHITQGGTGNPVAPEGTRTAADVVTPELITRLTRGVAGSGTTVSHTPFTGDVLASALPESTPRTSPPRTRTPVPPSGPGPRPRSAGAPPSSSASTICCCAASRRSWT